MEKTNVIQEVTAKLMSLLDKVTNGDIEYWIPISGMAYNPYSKHRYSSLNQLLLSLEMYERNYSHNNWLTFKQITKAGGKVRKDEQSSMITFSDTVYYTEGGKVIPHEDVKQTFMNAKKHVPTITRYVDIGIVSKKFLRLYYVFNVAQTEGLPEQLVQPQLLTLADKERFEIAEQVVRDTGAKIVHVSGNSAHYNLVKDKIQMPFLKQFKSSEHYYATLFHELTHWSAKRLNRPTGKSGTPEYAFEELIAEMGSTFMCAELGIEAPLTSSAAYVKSWLGALENDRTYILKAVSQAEWAVRFLMQPVSASV